MFYERTAFTCNGKAVQGWKVVYPLAERAVYDRIVEEMAGPLGEAARPSQGVAKRG